MDIHAKTLVASKVRILDISAEGMCIKGKKHLRLGSKCFVNLENKDTYVPVEGTIVWEKVSESIIDFSGEMITFFTAGIKFDDMHPQLTDILGIHEVSSIPDEESLRVKRFKIHNNKIAFVDYPETFVVKSLSLGGLLGETFNEVQVNSEFPMQLFLPKADSSIKLYGRVASCEPVKGRDPKLYNIGIEFMEMSEDNRLRLDRFIHSLLLL